MESFENGETNMLQFMDCLEDVLRYIDNFTCGHKIYLDVPTEQKVVKTGSQFSYTNHTKEQQLIFEIKRTKNTKVQQLLIHIVIENERECTLVKKCSISEKNIIDRASMRDLICSFFVPVLNIFPIIHLLSPENIVDETLPFSTEMPLLGFKVKGKTNVIFISLNSDDQLVTCTMKDHAKEVSFDTWKLDMDLNSKIFDQDMFMVISYVIVFIVS